MYAHSLRVTNSQKYPLLPRTLDIVEHRADRFRAIQSLLSQLDESLYRKIGLDRNMVNSLLPATAAAAFEIDAFMTLGDVVLLMATFQDSYEPFDRSRESTLDSVSFVSELLKRKNSLLALAASTIEGPDYLRSGDKAGAIKTVLDMTPPTDSVFVDLAGVDTAPGLKPTELIAEGVFPAGSTDLSAAQLEVTASEIDRVLTLSSVSDDAGEIAIAPLMPQPTQINVNDVLTDGTDGVVPEGAPPGNQATLIVNEGGEQGLGTTPPPT